MTGFEESGHSPLPDDLVREFEALDLASNEARVLLGLLRFGSANTAELARITGVARTSAYQVLEELSRRGLAERLSGGRPITYTTPGRKEVLRRLEADQEDRLRRYRERTARLEGQLEEAYPDAEEVAAGPYVHVLHSAGQVNHAYTQLLAGAVEEVLVFNREPYSSPESTPDPKVLAAVQRGVVAKVLYEADQWHAPDSAPFRAAADVYHAAGVKGRLVSGLALKLAIVDRSSVLLAMADPARGENGFPATLLVAHPGFGALLGDAFDSWWRRGEVIGAEFEGRAGPPGNPA